MILIPVRKRGYVVRRRLRRLRRGLPTAAHTLVARVVLAVPGVVVSAVHSAVITKSVARMGGGVGHFLVALSAPVSDRAHLSRVEE